MNKKTLLLISLFISAKFLLAQDGIQLKQSTPFVLGTIHELQSNGLSEKRILNIYLPEGYNQNDTIKYPVIYLLDGSADEDFIHIVGLVQFANFSWVNMLPKSILVGIANVDRKRDFTFPTAIEKDKKDFPTTGGSEKFILFIENELEPFIEKTYKTNTVKTIIGQSLGGLLATEVLFKKPYLFTNYIIVSPSLWWNNESLLSVKPMVLKVDLAQKISIYVAVGKEGKVMEGDSRKLVTILTSLNKKNVRVNFQHFIKESHATLLHQAVYKAFEVFTNLK